MNQCWRQLIVCIVLLRYWNAVEGSTRIVGGSLAKDGDYSFYAFPANTVLCGGTLIWKDILISAAHCGNAAWVDGLYLGGYNLYSRENTLFQVEKTEIHPSYDVPTKHANDIMLIKLTSEAPGPFVQLNFDVAVPSPGQAVTYVGYGATSETGAISNDMLQVNVTASSTDECRAGIGGILQVDTMLCTRGSSMGGKDACYGDSGGPVFVAGTKIQVGIISFGFGCAHPNEVSVNTRVSGYEEWIRSSICRLSASPPPACFSRSAGTVPLTQPVPVPAPVPVAIKTSVVVPIPVPKPVPAPLPVPKPVPVPQPVPSPIPLPVPRPVPAPIPAPIPVPQPVPAPVPVPKPVPVTAPKPLPTRPSFPKPVPIVVRAPIAINNPIVVAPSTNKANLTPIQPPIRSPVIVQQQPIPIPKPVGVAAPIVAPISVPKPTLSQPVAVASPVQAPKSMPSNIKLICRGRGKPCRTNKSCCNGVCKTLSTGRKVCSQ